MVKKVKRGGRLIYQRKGRVLGGKRAVVFGGR